MAIALYWNGTELEILRQVLVAAAADRTLTRQQRTMAQGILDAGLTNWQAAPVEPGPRAANDADCRRLVINTTTTLVQIHDFLAPRRFVVDGDAGDRYPGCIVKELLKAGGEQL